MPIYEYVCNKCKNKFELLRPFSRSTESARCPKCQNQADRVMSVCVSMSTDAANGVPKTLGGGNSCASCSSGNCGSCGS